MISIYEEALTDVQRLKEVAEENAKRKLIESMKPHIKNLIENEIMKLDDFGGAEGEGSEPLDIDVEAEEISDGVPQIASNPAPSMPPKTSGTSTPVEPAQAQTPTEDGVTEPEDAVNVTAIAGDNSGENMTMPDAEGKVTLDLDGLKGEPEECDDEVYELSLESVDTLSALKKATRSQKLMSETQLIKKIKLNEMTIKLLKQSPSYTLARNSTTNKINSLVEEIENMYGYVQELFQGSEHKAKIEENLEKQFGILNSLKEQREKIMKKKLVNEEDLTLKITGLPDFDEETLENVGVDLETGDEEEELDLGGEEDGDSMDFDMDSDDSGEEAAEDDMDFSMGDDDEEEVAEETTVFEIDESALRHEIKKMRALREAKAETKAQSWGHGVDKNAADDFGGGHMEKEPFEDGEVTTEADESNEVNQLQNRRKKDEKGNKVADQHDSMAEARFAKNSRSRELAETQKLRAELAETNLINAKLVATTKLLQLESLNKRQKAAIVDRIDEAKSPREVDLIYKSLTRALEKKPLAESVQRVRGSSSAVSQTSGAQGTLSEGFDTARMAKLAGLK
jgi:hypothetical protein